MDRFLTWPVWVDVTGVAAVIGLFAAGLFLTRYHIETGGSWWKQANGEPNFFGRMLFFRKFLVVTLFLMAIVRWYVPEWRGIDFLQAIVLSCFAGETFILYNLLMKAQRAAQESRRT